MLAGPGEAAVVANATSTVALVPGSLAGAWGYRRELRGSRRWLLLLFAPSLLGGLVGALLLTRTDPGYFKLVIPWLLLIAALLFLVQPYLPAGSRRTRRPAGPRSACKSPSSSFSSSWPSTAAISGPASAFSC